MKKLVIFDLDGTLLNTIADLAQSTNHALRALGYPTHELSEYPFMVGNGINKLFERALPEGEKTQENVLRMRAEFIPYYNVHNADMSRPYPGIQALLECLQAAGIQMAVASNKYQEATTKLIGHYFPTIGFAAVLGQREGIPVKPNPAIVYDILRVTAVSPADVLYVGDSGVDMQTALRAGVEACGVTWGFRPRKELEEFSPAHIVDKAEEIGQLCLNSFRLKDTGATCFIRPASRADIPELRNLFCSTVLTVNAKDYTSEEVADWASCGESIEHWEELLPRLHFLAATDATGHLIGFSSVRPDGYLHCLFVHKDWQGKGIASALLAASEQYAREHGANCMKSEVSITARPFFERRGYVVERQQKERANRLELTNFVMKKDLSAKEVP